MGRAFDQLFLADRASPLTSLSLQAITAYRIALDELHDDSTSLALYGAYRDAHGEPRGGLTPARPGRGSSKPSTTYREVVAQNVTSGSAGSSSRG